MCETFASDDISEIFQNSNKCALYIRSILVFFFFFFFFFEMKRKENRHYLKVAARLFLVRQNDESQLHFSVRNCITI